MTSSLTSKPEMTLLNFFRTFGKSNTSKDKKEKQEKKPSEKEFFKQAKMGANTQGSRERSQSAKQASAKRKYGDAAGAAPQEQNANPKSTRTLHRLGQDHMQPKERPSSIQISSNGYVEMIRIERCGEHVSAAPLRQRWVWACSVFGFPTAEVSDQQRSERFRLLSRLVHPDKNTDAFSKASAAFQRLNAANDVLKLAPPAGLPPLPPSPPASPKSPPTPARPASPPPCPRAASPSPFPQQTSAAYPQQQKPKPTTSVSGPSAAKPSAQRPQRKPPVTVPVPPAMPSEDQEQPFESALSGVEKFIDQNARTISRTISRNIQLTARSSISGVGIGRPTVGDVVIVLSTDYTRQYRANSIGQRCVITVDDQSDGLMPYQLEGCCGCFGEKDVRGCGISKVLREINGI